MMKSKNMYCLIVMLLCAACNPPQNHDVISKQHRQSYQCGLAIADFAATLSKDQEHLRLKLNDFEVGSDEPQSPFLELQDLMKNAEYMLFESTDSNNEHLNHTWQLLELKQEQEAELITTQGIAKDILETKNLHVALVRIAFHANNSQQHDQEYNNSHEDHANHDHDAHDHGGDPHLKKEYEGPSLSFAVYQQLRGQSKPSWCKVTAPVNIEHDGDTYQVQILKSAQIQVDANAEHGHPGHSHQH